MCLWLGPGRVMDGPAGGLRITSEISLRALHLLHTEPVGGLLEEDLFRFRRSSGSSGAPSALWAAGAAFTSLQD